MFRNYFLYLWIMKVTKTRLQQNWFLHQVFIVTLLHCENLLLVAINILFLCKLNDDTLERYFFKNVTRCSNTWQLMNREKSEKWKPFVLIWIIPGLLLLNLVDIKVNTHWTTYMVQLFYFAWTESVKKNDKVVSPFMILIGLECNYKSQYSYFDK